MNHVRLGSEREVSSVTDLRGFVYALEPVRSQRVWKLEKIRLELAQQQSQLLEQQQALARMNALLATGSSVALNAATLRLDPGAHVRSLSYLASLQKDIAKQGIKVDELLARQSELKQAHFQAHQLLDAMNQHRDLAIQEYESECLRRQALEADRDWLAHLAVSHGGADSLHGVAKEIVR